MTAIGWPPLVDVPDPDALARPEYWRDLAPWLSLDPPATAVPEVAWPEGMLAGVAEDLRKEGYFQLDPLLPPEVTKPLSEAVERLHGAGLPPTFLFVYTECWTIFHRVRALCAAALGEEFAWIPALWVFRLGQDYVSKGWGPHRDGADPWTTVRQDGSPKQITLWVPLTRATPLNGCMYVVPRQLDPGSLDGIDMQNIRALPADPGAVLGWNHALLHWGARSSTKGPGPRVALSVEFQRGDEEPVDQPLLLSAVVPSFEQRIGLVGRMLEKYQHFTSYPEEWVQCGKTLRQRFLVGGPPDLD